MSSGAMTIEVETDDSRLDFDLMGAESVEIGMTTEINQVGNLTWQGAESAKAQGVSEVTQFLLEIGAGVGAGLVANWLYNALRGRASRLVIDRTEVEITEGEIRRVIKEHLEL